MHYFKNHELANMFNVSQAAVGKWIAASKQKKLKITLVEHENKPYIANTADNLATIEAMVKQRRKYLNRRSLKTITPRPEFYKLYSHEQILDIMANLDIHRELPLQYTYFNGGADHWDNYTRRLAANQTSNLLNGTLQLLQLNHQAINSYISKYKYINVIDLGMGNAYPVKDFLGRLLDQDVLCRYIGLDISPEMITKGKQNIKRWFKGKVAFEGYVRDINYDRFVDLLASGSFGKDGYDTMNIILLLGGTLSNFRSPKDVLKVIYNSMGTKDLLIYTGMLDSVNTRLYFDFSNDPDSTSLSPRHKLIPDLLGLDESCYEVERLFDPEHQARFIRLRLKIAVNLKVEFKEGSRQIELRKGETILIYRHRLFNTMSILDLLNDSGFNLQHANVTEDHDFLLTISSIKTGQTKVT